MPGRIDYWNIGYPLLGALVYLTAPIVLGAIAYGLHRRWRMWRLGKPEPDLGPWSSRIRERLKFLAFDLFTHRRFARKRERFNGIMHFALFWGFTFLFLATVVDALEFNVNHYFHVLFPTAHFRIEEGFVWDVFGGLLAFVGVSMAGWRRYVQRPGRLNTFLDDGVSLAALLILVVTGFFLEGMRIGATMLNPASSLYAPHEAVWSPIGYAFAKASGFLGMSPDLMQSVHKSMWWSHAAIYTAWLVYVGVAFSKMMHILVSPANVFLAPVRPRGALASMGDFEQLETFGAKDLPDFTWKQLLNLDACTNCGRCQDQCPAWATDKPLSPRQVIQSLKGYMEERAPQLIAAGPGEAPAPSRSMVSDVVTEDVLWSCTSCAACVEACPVGIHHIDTIVDMRRYLAMEEARVPATAQSALENLEQRGHPWRGTTHTRTDWMEGLDVPTLAEHPDAEVLFWVGCTGALVDRNIRVTRSMARVLKKLGVDFAVLGNEEACTGDPARRMGNEYLFQILASQNVETFQRYGVKRVVTTCPHCFNTLRNEYPQLGTDLEVHHYSDFIDALVQSGRGAALRTISSDGAAEPVTYHDSCYLGRHNGVYDSPRRLAEHGGVALAEMDRCRERGFCCGAGGGRMWMEETTGKRINHVRTEQFLETDTKTVAVSCPFCLQMFEEGISAKGLEDQKRARDLVEILDERLSAPDETPSGAASAKD